MVRIGIVSDTHSFFEPSLYKVLHEVDEIWHAGDIGDIKTLQDFSAFKTTKAVYGNIDNAELRMQTAEYLFFKCEELTILLYHYGGKPPYYDKKALVLLEKYNPDIFICGHSHILRIYRDKQRNNMLFINPGACGVHGFHKVKTCIRLSIEGSRIFDVDVAELGYRSNLSGK